MTGQECLLAVIYASGASLCLGLLAAAWVAAHQDRKWRSLLRRYIGLVGAREGVDFIPRVPGLSRWANISFTQEELDELHRLAEETP